MLTVVTEAVFMAPSPAIILATIDFQRFYHAKAGKAPWRQAGMAVIYRVWVQWVAVHARR